MKGELRGVQELVNEASDEDLRAELLYLLARASRVNERGEARKALRRLLDQPHVLDFLERELAG